LATLVSAKAPSARTAREKATNPAADDPPPADPLPPVAPPEPTPASEEPVAEPAPEPTETTPPESYGGSGGGTPAPEQSPTPTPAPPPPAGFTLGFDVSQPGAPKACACAGPTKVESSNVGATSAGIERLDQVLTGSASVDGTPTYGMWVDHQSPSGTAHYMDFRLYTPEGGYFYSASGTLADRTLMDWAGWQYTYKGSYRLGSRPGGTTEQMTSTGTYTLVVQASWAENRVVSSHFTITSGS
jgi:hypothetical protein